MSGRSRYRYYLLFVLLLFLAVVSLDRLTLALVLQSIKADLRLSDTQLGFLTGIAFAVFYSGMGIPIARWADRGNRVTILTVTTVLWSLAMLATGLARNFGQLLLVRIGVAVGEAGCVPPSQSLLPDYFEREERPHAVSIYLMGTSLGALFGYPLAGWLNEHYGWRATFVLIGLPGFAVALLGWLTLREPRRAAAGGSALATDPGLGEVLRTLVSNRSFRHLVIAFSIICFFGSGIVQWLPAFFMRSYHVGALELGEWFAVLFGVGGVVGLYAGGATAAFLAPGNEQRQFAVTAGLYGLFTLLEAGIFVTSNFHLALGLAALAAIGAAAISGPLFSGVQTLVPPRMRATSIALIYLAANLLGLGVGPLLAGALSDALRPVFGEDSLKYALLSLCPGFAWAAWHLWRASRTVMADIASVRAAEPAAPIAAG